MICVTSVEILEIQDRYGEVVGEIWRDGLGEWRLRWGKEFPMLTDSEHGDLGEAISCAIVKTARPDLLFSVKSET